MLIKARRACSRPVRAFQGVKKPYNPIMGEVFHCKWDYGDKGTTLYIAEQVLAPCNEARKAAQLRMRGLCSVGWASCRRAKPPRTKCQSVRRCRTTRQCLRSTR